VSWQQQLFLRPGLVRALRGVARRLGFEVTGLGPHDAEPHWLEIYDRVEPFTMTSLSRVFACIAAAEHVSKRGIEGAIVECGVWKGGSSMAALLALVRRSDFSREVWLYDTYEGMTAPGEHDAEANKQLFASHSRDDGSSDWCRAELGEVFANIESCGYPMAQMKFIKGRVEKTIPGALPDRISVLRLDTDFYESTRHELEHLYPRLSSGGILMIDDYGAHAGAKRAVDEFLLEESIDVFLSRIDSSGRLLIKP